MYIQYIYLYIYIHKYLQSLVVSLSVLLLQQQLLDVCVQLCGVCVCVLLQLSVSSLLFLQTHLQRPDLLVLHAQLGLLQITEQRLISCWREEMHSGSESCFEQALIKTALLLDRVYVMRALPWRRFAPPALWR